MTPEDRCHFEPLVGLVESAIERGETTGTYFHSEVLRLLRAADVAREYVALAADGTGEPSALQGAYDLALIQIRHDGEVIQRLTKALRVAAHGPHDRDGEPDDASGFPTCSGCGAILTDDATASPGLDVERLARAVPERLPSGSPQYDREAAAFNEGRAAVLAALAAAQTLRCGDHPKFGHQPLGLGCGQPLIEVEAYRCARCDTAFHKACIRQHFDWPEAGGGPMPHAVDAALASLAAAASPGLDVAFRYRVLAALRDWDAQDRSDDKRLTPYEQGYERGRREAVAGIRRAALAADRETT